MIYQNKFKDGTEIQLGTIYCIGRNYGEHIKEMGYDKNQNIVVFIKPRTALNIFDNKLELPDFSEDVHHEIEIVFLVTKDAYKISKDKFNEHIGGLAVGIDFTLRDLQGEAKKMGEPWAISKGFYKSAPISNFIPIENINIHNISFELKVNGETRQIGNTKDMINSPEELFEFLNHRFYLCEGDIIFTGTPSGVSRIVKGDKLELFLENNKERELDIL